MSSRQRLPRVLLVTLVACAFAGAAYADKRPARDTARIEQITGPKGTFSKQENVFKVSKPRTDVKVQVDDWTMPPFMGLTSWAAFTPAHGSQVMLRGDTALFEDEVNPVMSTALDAGLEVTALHNHDDAAVVATTLQCDEDELQVVLKAMRTAGSTSSRSIST